MTTILKKSKVQKSNSGASKGSPVASGRLAAAAGSGRNIWWRSEKRQFSCHLPEGKSRQTAGPAGKNMKSQWQGGFRTYICDRSLPCRKHLNQSLAGKTRENVKYT